MQAETTETFAKKVQRLDAQINDALIQMEKSGQEAKKSIPGISDWYASKEEKWRQTGVRLVAERKDLIAKASKDLDCLESLRRKLGTTYEPDKALRQAFAAALRSAYALPEDGAEKCAVCHRKKKKKLRTEKDHIIEVQVWAAAEDYFHRFSCRDFLHLAQLVNSADNCQTLCKRCNAAKGQYWKHKLKRTNEKFLGTWKMNRKLYKFTASVFVTLLARVTQLNLPDVVLVFYAVQNLFRDLFPTENPM